MAYCKNCGGELESGVNFCPYCGSAVANGTSTQTGTTGTADATTTGSTGFSNTAKTAAAVAGGAVGATLLSRLLRRNRRRTQVPPPRPAVWAWAG